MSIINTHGIEEEENEHAVERRQYTDITPRAKQSDMVMALKNMAGDKYLFKCLDSFEWQAAEYIIDLEKENKFLLNILEGIYWDRSKKLLEGNKTNLEKENEFLKSLIRKYHLDNDVFTGKGNMDGTTLQNKFTK